MRYSVVIVGPTAVGKTALALELASKIRSEIINADVGQLYGPLCIGTAKPLLPHPTVPHHMFDVLQEPVSMSARVYRDRVQELMSHIQQRDGVPLIVGGSGFYGMSLLYPPRQHRSRMIAAGEGGWERLQRLDPERAQKIHPHDQYRIQRALVLYEQTGMLPSELKPVYDPVGRLLVVYVTRDRAQLRERIAVRTAQMLKEGWIEEVRGVLGTEWESFLLDKKILGYDDIIRWLRAGQGDIDAVCQMIVKKTNAYAKRQETYYKMFVKKVRNHPEHRVVVCNLTEGSVDLYIGHLMESILRGLSV